MTFSWTQPVDGKVVEWRPLTVGDNMDLDANYQQVQIAHLKKYAQYAMRVVNFDGKPGFQVNDFRTWDAYDLEAFAEEVVMREQLRASALTGQRNGSAVQRLEASINKAQAAATELGQALADVLASAKAAEQNAPLAPGLTK